MISLPKLMDRTVSNLTYRTKISPDSIMTSKLADAIEHLKVIAYLNIKTTL